MKWFIFGIAILAVFGHVCAFSFHAHAAELHVHLSDVSVPVPSAHDHEEAGGSGPDADHSSHGASCDAVRPAPATALPVMAMTTHVDFDSSKQQAFNGTPYVRLGVVSSAPPLFLLHASLLI